MRVFTPSPREREIIELVLQAMQPKDIAVKLGMSHHTIKAHFNRMYMRAGIVDGMKLVKLATMMYRRGQ